MRVPVGGEEVEEKWSRWSALDPILVRKATGTEEAYRSHMQELKRNRIIVVAFLSEKEQYRKPVCRLIPE